MAGNERTIIRKPGLSSCSKKRVLKAGSICMPVGGVQSDSIIRSMIADTGIPVRPKKYAPFRSSTVMDQPPVSVRAAISYSPGLQKTIRYNSSPVRLSLILLLTPGRICTSSPELGVPSAFADISEFNVIAEVSETKAGYIPELSYGSHIFQDLVEAGILYTAVFEGGHTKAYRPDMLGENIPDITEEITRQPEENVGILKVYDVSGSDIYLYYDLTEERLLIAKK